MRISLAQLRPGGPAEPGRSYERCASRGDSPLGRGHLRRLRLLAPGPAAAPRRELLPRARLRERVPLPHLGIAVWLKAPASRVTVTLHGRRVTLATHRRYEYGRAWTGFVRDRVAERLAVADDMSRTVQLTVDAVGPNGIVRRATVRSPGQPRLGLAGLREAEIDPRRRGIGPARGDDLAARVEVDRLGPVDVPVAEERRLPPAERVVGDG